jgi:hypothetical protein
VVTLPAGFDIGPRYALVIGNDDYASRGHGIQSLASAAADARAVGELLESRYGYEVHPLVDATRDEIMVALSELAALSPEHNLLIFYAGHGFIDDNGRGYWWPVDAEPHNPANWVANREIYEALIDVRARRVLIVADSCFAGSLASEGEALVDPNHLLDKDARLVLTSGGLKPVPDRGLGRHSLFTEALLAQLRGTAGPLTTGELHRRLERALEGVQEPQWNALFGHGNGEFLLVPRTS